MSERSLPLFPLPLDPGPSFAELLRRVAPHQLPNGELGAGTAASAAAVADVPHGTTVAAIRFADGVVMAGAAGPAIEMVRLFQVQLEHYEKVQGSALSLEGKANQLSQLIRANLNA